MKHLILNQFKLALLLVVVIFTASCGSQADNSADSDTGAEVANLESETPKDTTNAGEDSNTPENNSPSEEAKTQAPDGDINQEEVQQQALFEDYSSARLAKYRGERPVALFFHADWCPVCIEIEDTIENNLAQIPTEAVILKVNFDEETELKKEFKITTQSTLVFLDRDGQELAKKNNPSIDEIINNL
jgi:thiol-disulfide isomerase/thioredoxin